VSLIASPERVQATDRSGRKKLISGGDQLPFLEQGEACPRYISNFGGCWIRDRRYDHSPRIAELDPGDSWD